MKINKRITTEKKKIVKKSFIFKLLQKTKQKQLNFYNIKDKKLKANIKKNKKK